MNFQNASGEPKSALGFGEKAAIKLQRETRSGDLDLLPLSERRRMLIYPDMPSKGLNVKKVIPDFRKEWPGLPKGVKFDPSDEELLWHLLAEMGKGVAKRHPFINEFIVSLDEDAGLGNLHPQFLPGVKQDGSVSYFFHRKIEMHRSRNLKRQKKQDNSVEICWNSIGKSNLVCVDGIHQGSKEVLSLYMNPVTGGNPLKTPWLMHQYCIGINETEEDLVVSKIFYEIRSKQDIQDSRTDSVDGLVAAVVGVADSLQVAPEFHERLNVGSVSADASTQAVELGIGETNVKLVEYLKSARCLKHPIKYLERAKTNLYKNSEGTRSTDELALLESACETAAEISIFSTSAKSEIRDEDQKECVVEKRAAMQDDFQSNLGDSGNWINNYNYDEVIDDTCDSNDAQVSMEKSCPKIVPEHDLQKNIRDKMFKTQGRFIATKSGEINTTSIYSFAGHISGERHEAYSKCLDEAHVSPSSISSAEHSIAHENSINDLFILGLPAYSLKGKPSEGTEPIISFENNSNNWVNISAQSALPIKIEPKSFVDTEIDIASEKFSSNRLNVSAPSGMLIKVKNEPFEEAEASIILEKYVEKLSSFSQLSCPEEGTPSCNLSHLTHVPKDLRIPSAEILNSMISGLDKLLSETTGLMNQHPEEDDNVQDGLLMSNDNSQVIGDAECFNQSSYAQINVHAGEPQSNSVSTSSSLNVKSEPVESSLLSCSQIPPCKTRGHVSLTFENKKELYSDFQSDILDHVPLKLRLGISVSEGDVNVKNGNISEEIARVTPGCRSFGSVNTKECLSSRRRKRKKTATDSVLLDRGIQVEEIKLYGDLEDDDPLETSSSEGCFEELETVMTKLFSERLSLLRFTSGRPVKGARAVYCLAGLISLIEQVRYLRFRQTPIDWGWCRDLQSFIFVFEAHNRIVLERPEYGYATYFFELVDSLPIDWQIRRLIRAMKLTNFSRTILLENKPLIVGEDLSEGEALVLEAYGWARNTGFGTLLNYRDRVVHDRRNVVLSEWRAKIGKLLMNGYAGGRMVLTDIPKKVEEYLGNRSPEIKMEL
ncbi:hypothetical protein IEQ34_017197 [Dendrobium chrysotoxum]|uniref:NAC domain-containing protein n=1 Tax=Dendrobium chrysotoxum TaxID=161865 RepID=A0AAV7GAH5_DENCH|nr:hypothetical protein IEQ34_017197 [Dendrobium chrysotoxum]